MSKGKEDLEMLREKNRNLIENEGFEMNDDELEVLRDSKTEGMGHSGGQVIAEIKLTVTKKYGGMNQMQD